MKILITGATGLVGSALIRALEPENHEIYRLSRSTPDSDHDIQWDARDGFTGDEAKKLEGLDAVVHLAGENVAGGSWTEERKGRIRDSRVVGTRTLVKALSETKEPPKILIGASAVGYYGDRKNEVVTEESGPGEGFLGEICIEWEAEINKALEFGARVAIPRIGIVLAKDGGALEKMVTPFSYGLGGTVGSGEQWMPWIAIDDLVDILVYALENDEVSGAFNATSPNPAQNKDFTEALASVLNRPAFIPVPAFGIKLIFGEMGNTLLLQGARVIPRRLEQLGYKFKFPELEPALAHVLGD
ncbi:MAG: TIGR01777 family oxidoreductase [Acidobacteriota bacterium]|nr:TIGR01777 family oxidoreductase [Acidobacteriota bacterium]MDH3529419.1 TIGR01777 family oxidoreductase [Acidobacteriota bacterium]